MCVKNVLQNVWTSNYSVFTLVILGRGIICVCIMTYFTYFMVSISSCVLITIYGK